MEICINILLYYFNQLEECSVYINTITVNNSQTQTTIYFNNIVLLQQYNDMMK